MAGKEKSVKKPFPTSRELIWEVGSSFERTRGRKEEALRHWPSPLFHLTVTLWNESSWSGILERIQSRDTFKRVCMFTVKWTGMRIGRILLSEKGGREKGWIEWADRVLRERSLNLEKVSPSISSLVLNWSLEEKKGWIEDISIPRAIWFWDQLKLGNGNGQSGKERTGRKWTKHYESYD